MDEVVNGWVGAGCGERGGKLQEGERQRSGSIPEVRNTSQTRCGSLYREDHTRNSPVADEAIRPSTHRHSGKDLVDRLWGSSSGCPTG